MSVDYYFACGKHMKCIHVAQDGFSGFTFYRGEPECMKALGTFLEEHTLCASILYLPEHQVEDMQRVEWIRAGRPAMNEWNPIDSAPDGEWVLCVYRDSERAFMGKKAISGWHGTSGDQYGPYCIQTPLYWMPLPPPPRTGAAHE